MARKQYKRWPLTHVGEKYQCDDVTAALLALVEAKFDQLWPSDLRPPYALIELQAAMCDLIGWTMATDRSRASMRERRLQQIAQSLESRPGDGNDLLYNRNAHQVVPGLIAEILALYKSENFSDLPEASDTEDLLRDIDEWLSE